MHMASLVLIFVVNIELIQNVHVVISFTIRVHHNAALVNKSMFLIMLTKRIHTD